MLFTLYRMLQDEGAFVRNWAIASQAVTGVERASVRDEIVRHVRPMTRDGSKAVRTRALRAMAVLTGSAPLPDTWVKRR